MQELTVQRLKEVLESTANLDGKSLFLLDVREKWEYETGAIEASVHIPMRDLPQRIQEIPKDKAVIAICQHGNRSAVVTQWLEKQGYDVYNLKDGMSAWDGIK